MNKRILSKIEEFMTHNAVKEIKRINAKKQPDGSWYILMDYINKSHNVPQIMADTLLKK